MMLTKLRTYNLTWKIQLRTATASITNLLHLQPFKTQWMLTYHETGSIKNLYFLPEQYIYVFCMYLTTNKTSNGRVM